MKKYLILSIAFNIAVVIFILGKRYYYAHSAPAFNYSEVRNSMFAPLTIDTSDIVFVGDSHIEIFMVSEFFQPRCKNRGINGNCISDVTNRIASITKYHPRKIVLECGVNDLIAGRQLGDIISDYKNLVDRIRKQSPGTYIIVQSVLPTSKEKNLKEKTIEVNARLKEMCEENNLQFIDLFDCLQKDGYLIEQYTYDGMHLNGKGYAILAKQIKSYL